MRLSLFILVTLVTLAGCKSMNDRTTASVDPKIEIKESKTPGPTRPIILDEYYRQIVNNLNVKLADKEGRIGDRCSDNQGPSCISVSCSLGGFNCRSSYDLGRVAELCKDSYGDCIEVACKQGGYNCRSSYDLSEAITTCRESRGECVRAVCGEGGYNCRSSYDLKRVVTSCQTADGKCITEICKQGGYNCRYADNLNRVIDLCKE